MQTVFSSPVILLALAAVISNPIVLFGQGQRVRIDTPNLVATVSYGSLGTYEEVPSFQVAFPGENTEYQLTIESVPDASGMSTPDRISVLKIEQIVDDLADGIVVESCLLVEGVAEGCRDVTVQFRIPGSGKLLEMRVQESVKWASRIFRVSMKANQLRLKREETDKGVGNEAIVTVLPTLSRADMEYAESRPFLRFDFNPIVREATSGESGDTREAIGFTFDGDVFREKGKYRYGLSWSGAISTDSDLAFNALNLNLEYERNLRKGTFVPFVVAVANDVDQDFDVVDSSVAAELRFQLPVYLNMSPFYDFAPVVGPQVRIVANYGRRLRGVDDDSTTNGEAGTVADTSRDFERLGYEIRWRIPLSANTILRFHHAGVWDWSDFLKDDYHPLWDAVVQFGLGELTYLIGYQRGSAAPLFQPTETVRTGLVIGFK